ncbi:hypothetical protein HYW75_02285 [Candidatus Pacearchaeota archaeon]|nr:hypothetical protein [Candidatus Pacearchaeota archaeon]
METLFFDRISEIRKEKNNLERELGVKIKIKGKEVSTEGTSFDEYEARIVLEAIQFGFSSKIALSLRDEHNIFRRIHIKDFTKRKKLEDVRARIIGTEGKTKRTIENISNTHLIIKGNEVGIIGTAETIEEATTAITNLIRGSKQSNVYHFLERMNAEKKRYR